MAEPTTDSTSGCGCCQEEPKTVDDRVQELLVRRQRLERNLHDLDRRELAGAAR